MVTHRFRVRNTTGRPVVIREKIPTCSCTASELAKSTLADGEETTLTLSVKTTDATTSYDVACRLVTDHPSADLRDWVYTLYFRSYGSPLIEPQSIVFGDVDGAAGPAQPFVVEHFRPAGEPVPETEDWDVPAPLRVLGGKAPIVETIEGGRVLRYRWTYKLALTKAAFDTSGTQARDLALTMTGAAAAPRRDNRASARVSWTALTPWIVEPEGFHFGLVDRDEDRTRVLVVKTRDGRPRRLLDATVDGGSGDVVIETIEPAKGANAVERRVVIRFRSSADSTSRARSGNIVLRWDAESSGVLIIPWSALLR